MNGLTVGLVVLFRNHCCKPFVHGRCCWPHATRSGKNERREAAMLHFPDTFVIGSSLLKFIPAEALCKRGIVVGWG